MGDCAESAYESTQKVNYEIKSDNVTFYAEYFYISTDTAGKPLDKYAYYA